MGDGQSATMDQAGTPHHITSHFSLFCVHLIAPSHHAPACCNPTNPPSCPNHCAQVLDKTSTAVEHTADIVVAAALSGSEGGGTAGGLDDAAGAARQALDQLTATVEPLLAPIKAETDRVVDTLLADPVVEGVVRQAVGVVEEMNKVASELQSGVQEVIKQQQQR